MYIAHDVGAGKTLSASVLAMESKRLGLAQKPTIVVLKSTLKQFATEFIDAYPDANILVADEAMLDRKNLRKFYARLMSENWDAVIMTHQGFEKLPMSEEFMAVEIEKELEGYRAILEEVPNEERGTRKQIEAQIQKFEDRLEAMGDQSRKIVGVDFEDTGIDMVIVDEAHHHKKIPFATRQGSTKGVDADGSGIAYDMFLKSKYLNSIRPGRGMTLMSGTPVTNTLGELFNIQRYLQPDMLAARGLSSFDSWSATFAESRTELEMQAGGKFAPSTRLAKFVGVPGLMRDFLQVADIVGPDVLREKLKGLPRVAGGGRRIVTTPLTEAMTSYQALLNERIEAIEKRKGPPEKGQDIILSVMTDARKAAIDMRLLGLPQTEPSKLDVMIDDVYQTWLETRDKEYFSGGKREPRTGSTQLIFSEWVETDQFSIHQHIKDTLIARGVPKEEVVSIQDYPDQKKKKKLFRQVNTGEVRIVIGGSKNLGTGTNVQQRLIALNHLDIDYLPANIVQREGRGIRQGNKNEEIDIRAYAASGTIDAFMWQLNETKQRMINQVMSGDFTVDAVEDVADNVSQMAQAKALASGNPLLLEQAGLQSEVQKLQALRNSHHDLQQQYRRQAGDIRKSLPEMREQQKEFKELAANVVPTDGDKFRMTINGREFTERAKAGNQLLAMALNQSERTPMGMIGGVELYSSMQFGGVFFGVHREGGIITPTMGAFDFEASAASAKNGVGFVRRLEGLVQKISGMPRIMTEAIEEAENKLKMIEGQLGAEFQYTDELTAKEARLAEINEELAPKEENEDQTDIEDQIAEDDDGSFHINDISIDQGMSARNVRRAIQPTVVNWESGPEVHVVQSAMELPGSLRSLASRTDGQISGAYERETGKVYLIADAIRDPDHAKLVLAHEAVGHFAFEREFQDELSAIYTNADFTNDEIAGAIAAEVAERYPGYTQTEQAAEIVARLAESQIRHPIWLRIKAAIRNLLRRLGLNLNYTRQDLEAMLVRANNALRRPASRPAPRGPAVPSVGPVTGNATAQAVPHSDFVVPDELMRHAFVRKMQDKFFQVKRTQAAIRQKYGDDTITEEMDVYLTEELTHGRIEEDLFKFEERVVKPFVKELADSDMTMEELDLYLMARHAKDRNQHIRDIDPSNDAGSGMTDGEAEFILRRFKTEGKVKEGERLAKHIWRMNKERMRIILASGLETPATIMGWMEQFGEHYVPLKGTKAEDGKSGMLRIGQGYAIRGKESLHAMGRRTMAESPTLHSMAQFEETLVRREKVRVGRALKKLVEAFPNEAEWSIHDAENMPTRKWLNPTTLEVQIIPDTAMYRDTEYFPVKVDGKQYFVRLRNTLMQSAMHNLGPEKLNWVMGGLNRFNRFLASVSTNMNPEFVPTNAVRDIQTALFGIQAEQDLSDGKIKGMKLTRQVLKNYPKAMAAAYRGLRRKPNMSNEWDRWWQEYKESGAKIGFFGLKNYETLSSEIQGQLRRAQSGHNAVEAALAVKHWIDEANGSVENAIRFSTYVAARKAGVTKARAASLSKNLTVNFNRKGELGVWGNTLFLFYNASVQGIAQMARVIKSKRARQLAGGIIAFAAVLAELNRVLSDDDEDDVSFYDKIPDYEKERNIILMNPWGEPGDYWKFPLPYGYNIFHVMGTVANETVRGARSPQDGAGMLVRTFLGSFNPLGTEDSDSAVNATAKTLTPTIGKPWMQLALNEKFYGGPIYRENFPAGTPRPDSALGMDSTAEHWKVIAEFMNDATGGSDFRPGWIDVHPESLEHFQQFLTGGAGSFLERNVKLVENIAAGNEIEARDIPLARRFYGQSYDYEDTGRFYDRYDELMQFQDEYEALQESSRFEASKFRRRYRDQLNMVPQAEKTNRTLRGLWEERRELEDRDQSTDGVETRINREVDKFNRIYNQRIGL